MRNLKKKFAVSIGGLSQLRKAHSLSELIESLPKRLKNWGSIEFRDEDGDRVVVDRAIMEDANWSLQEVIDDWKSNVGEEEKRELVITVDLTKPFGQGTTKF